VIEDDSDHEFHFVSDRCQSCCCRRCVSVMS
jgi:hypothetical protein